MKKKKSTPRRQPIEAAGGIVMRGRVRPLFAVVQLRRQKTWVLPKGKLNRDETALAAAKREAIEETGHDVTVHEFLGSLGYKSSGRPKTVRFWRMEASGRPVAKLMRDVRAVRWLPLSQATARLTHEREQVFLEKVGRHILRQAMQPRGARKAPVSRRKTVKAVRKRPGRTAGGPDKHPADSRMRNRQQEGPARRLKVMAPVRAEKHRPRPRDVVRNLWTWLRR
jgi:8-oxo-dGTP diphosphatase